MNLISAILFGYSLFAVLLSIDAIVKNEKRKYWIMGLSASSLILANIFLMIF